LPRCPVWKKSHHILGGPQHGNVSFVWGTEIDTAAIDVQGKLEDEINELPDDIVRPRIRKFDIASFPVVLLGISSNLDPVELTELIEVQIRYRFARIPGVAQVDVWGGFNREVRIELDPDRIKAVGLPLDRVIEAIRDANLDLPAGKIEQGRYEVMLRAPAEFVNLDQIRDTVIVQRDGAAITLGQIAEVKDTYEKLTRIVRVNGGRGLRVAIRKQANANTVEVSKRILAEIEAANQAFLRSTSSRSSTRAIIIERSIANVARSVLYGGGLAIVVLLFFLRNIRSTLVISLSIPDLNRDHVCIDFLRGIHAQSDDPGRAGPGGGHDGRQFHRRAGKHLPPPQRNGETPEEASVEGAREVGPAIIASTITTLVIFLPLIFVRGVSGILFKELAYVIIFALICSLTVSLSLVPMLASRLLKSNRQPQGAGCTNETLGRCRQMYLFGSRKRLSGSAALGPGHRLVTVLAAAAVLGASLLLLPLIGSEFLPPSDEGEVRVTGKMEIGTRLDLVDRQTRIMERIVQPAVPEAVASVVSVGASGWRADAGSEGEIRLSLLPAAQRDRSNVEIAQDLRRRLEGQVPGMEIRVRAPQGQFILERILGGDEGLTVEIRGFELATLDALARSVAR
jgi:HAE1 family hydrophobic/amphiphilic exporter-1